jgi:1,2-diacylglycerol 3-alpha-glucosyltransferase
VTDRGQNDEQAARLRTVGADPGEAGAMTDRSAPLRRSPVRRVLITTDWFTPAVNGVVASVQTLRAELEALGCEVRVLTLSNRLRSYREGDVYYLGSVSATALYDRARIGTLLSNPIRRSIEEWGPDVVHSQCEFTTFVWARRLAQDLAIPLVHTYHTIYEDYTHYFSPSRPMGRKLAATFSRKVLAGTDAVVVPTGKVETILRSYHVQSPIHVCPTGLDLTHFRPVRTRAELEDAALLRRRLGIAPDRRILLSLGRLAREKNIDELIDLVAGLDDPSATLLLVGDGPYRTQLEEKARRSGLGDRVVFAGAVPPRETVRYYRLADVFVSASRSETQGLTYIEALACGLPAVCRRDPSLDGVIVDDLNGWQYGSPAEFRAAVARLAEPAVQRRVSASAAHWSAEHTSAGAFGRKILAVYESAVASERPRALARLRELTRTVA